MKSSTLFECAPLPPMSAWRPPDIIHIISVPKTFPFFLPFYCFHFILNANRRTKMGEAWEQGTSGCYWGLSKVLPQMTKHSFLRISALLLPILSADIDPCIIIVYNDDATIHGVCGFAGSPIPIRDAANSESVNVLSTL